MEGDLILGGWHAMRYTDDVLLNCTLETYIILLIDAIPINVIKKEVILGAVLPVCCVGQYLWCLPFFSFPAPPRNRQLRPGCWRTGPSLLRAKRTCSGLPMPPRIRRDWHCAHWRANYSCQIGVLLFWFHCKFSMLFNYLHFQIFIRIIVKLGMNP